MKTVKMIAWKFVEFLALSCFVEAIRRGYL